MTSSSRPSAPLRHPWFRWLGAGMLITYVGAWMQVVGIQWAVLDSAASVAGVALVPTMALLPVVLGALPAGLLADRCDPRRLLLVVLAYVVVVASALALLVAAGRATPALVLIFTFLLGLAMAVLAPTWSAVIMALVPRGELAAAYSRDHASAQLARLLGPALAGLVIIGSGVWNVFALYAFSVVLLAVPLLLWHPPAVGEPRRLRDRYDVVLRVGVRCVRRQPAVRLILVRTVLFAAPAAALWALLPVIARQQLGVGAGGYALLVAALGAGAVLATLLGARVPGRGSRGFAPTETLPIAGGLVFAAALVVVAMVPVREVVLLGCVLAGWAWTTAVSTSQAQVRPFLPRWLQPRGLVVQPVVLAAAVAVPAMVWGLTAELVGEQGALLIAAAAMLAGVVLATVRPTRPSRTARPVRHGR